MSVTGYLFDEHVNPRICRALKRRAPEINAWRVGDVGASPRGTPDPEILIWYEQNDCWLVTNNRASMPVHLRDHLAVDSHVPGIFILNPGMTMGQTVEELVLIWGTADPGEYSDRLEFLPVSS